MKLLNKWSRVSVGATIIVFLVAAAALFVSLRFVMLEQIDDDLKIEESEIQIFVAKHKRLPEAVSLEDQMIEYRNCNGAGSRHFRTTDLQEHGGLEMEKCRQLVFYIEDQSGWYEVTVSKSLEQTDGLIRSIFGITVVTISLILLISVLVNRWAVKRLWRPFYAALRIVSHHKLSSGEAMKLPDSSIDEFKTLNASLANFAGHAQLEYLALKTFSENATHELQTPIAVIRSKLDLLLQEQHLSEAGVTALQASFNALHRLDRLNQSLLLLARIENKQFTDTTRVNLADLLREKIGEFQELFSQKAMAVETQLQDVQIEMNVPLCHVLLNNLLSNAWRHGAGGGKVTIRLDEHHLELGNTAVDGHLDHKLLFRRFHPASAGSESTGLGLALIQEICWVSGFEVSYSFERGHHYFNISFRKVN
ncbi:MAG: hypothetical protein EOO08_11570 [Chitinophagaceae bacterium]|nr:MAG: hypothetical protein EOO08_11570 [Chitinophagaceae bacterium]